MVRRVDENTHEADAIILSDYGKGLLQSGGLTQAVINIGRSRGIPVFVDPKGREVEIGVWKGAFARHILEKF